MCAPVGIYTTSWPSIKIGDCHPDFLLLWFMSSHSPCLIASTSNDVNKRMQCECLIVGCWCCLQQLLNVTVSLEILMYSKLPIEFPKLSLCIDQETMVLEISYLNFLSDFWLGWRMRYRQSGLSSRVFGMVEHLSIVACVLHELI